ncbi:MAG: DUF6798 domain-containing protein [Bacteroidota bacterium]
MVAEPVRCVALVARCGGIWLLARLAGRLQPLTLAVLSKISTPSKNWKPETASLPLWLALLTLVGAFLRFGYVYGTGDQDELIPSVLHLLDGALFTQDWLVQTVTSGVNVRTYFLWLTALPSLALPVWLTSAVLWGGVMVALAYGVYGLAWEVTRSRLGAALAVPVALAVAVKWTLGANALVSNAHVPESVAWALIVPAVTVFLQRRWVRAGLLLGVAAWLHLLAAAQVALVLGVVGLAQAVAAVELDGRQLRADFVALLAFGGVFLLAALPALGPVVLDQLTPSGGLAEAAPPFYIHAQFRNPFHHLFSSFEVAHHLRFWPLVALGLASGVGLDRRGALRHGRALAVGGSLVAALCALAVVFVEVVPVTLVAKLQFFKLTVLVNLLCSVLIAAALVHLLPAPLRRTGRWLLEQRRAGLALALGFAFVVGVLAVQGVGRPGALLVPVRHLASPLGEAEQWARAETPPDALFAVPPSVSSFRSFAHRAVVANYAGFVFADRDMQVWFRRLMDLAPISPPETGIGVKPVLDAAYARHEPEAWRRLQSGYGIDYILMPQEAAALPFRVAFENEGWLVYRLPEATS